MGVQRRAIGGRSKGREGGAVAMRDRHAASGRGAHIPWRCSQRLTKRSRCVYIAPGAVLYPDPSTAVPFSHSRSLALCTPLPGLPSCMADELLSPPRACCVCRPRRMSFPVIYRSRGYLESFLSLCIVYVLDHFFYEINIFWCFRS